MLPFLFDVTNDVQPGASWADFEQQNNPLAAAYNVIKVYGLNNPGCNDAGLDITLLYAVNGAGASIDFTQTVAISDLRYYKIAVTDCEGNEAAGLLDVTSITTLKNIDTSALNPAKAWKVTVYLTDAVTGIDCVCESGYQFFIADIPGNPTDTITTVAATGTLAVEVDVSGTKTAIADGGTQALNGGTAAVGDVVNARIYITNIVAGSLVTISAVAASGDGSFNSPNGAQGITPVLVNDSVSIQSWVANIDTSTVGAKTLTVTITNNSTIAVYNFDLTVTVS